MNRPLLLAGSCRLASGNARSVDKTDCVGPLGGHDCALHLMRLLPSFRRPLGGIVRKMNIKNDDPAEGDGWRPISPGFPGQRDYRVLGGSAAYLRTQSRCRSWSDSLL